MKQKLHPEIAKLEEYLLFCLFGTAFKIVNTFSILVRDNKIKNVSFTEISSFRENFQLLTLLEIKLDESAFYIFIKGKRFIQHDSNSLSHSKHYIYENEKQLNKGIYRELQKLKVNETDEKNFLKSLPKNIQQHKIQKKLKSF